MELDYCPPNITLNVIWTNHGVSHCFMDTVLSAVLAGFIFIFGTIQLLMYKRYATHIEDPNQISVSKLYGFQLFLLLLVPVLSIVRFALEATFFAGAKVYGYMVSKLIDRSISMNIIDFEYRMFINCRYWLFA